MSKIWEACNGHRHIKPLRVDVIRIVESQVQIATIGLVDTSEEQLLLEQMLDSVKPPTPKSKQRTPYHYLIETPFRYPPLRHGSRFGSRALPSLFYGSLGLNTALAESAYYRLLFWAGMKIPPPNERIITEHTSFEVTFKTEFGVHLESRAFYKYRNNLSSPTDYSQTQLLGETMRDANVQAFTFLSARDDNKGINAAAFSLKAIQKKAPKNLQQWICNTNAQGVSYTKQHAKNEQYTYPYSQFEVKGKLPQPAS